MLSFVDYVAVTIVIIEKELNDMSTKINKNLKKTKF